MKEHSVFDIFVIFSLLGSLFLGIAHAEQGFTGRARPIFAEILEENPEFPALPWLSRTLSSEEDVGRTVELLKTYGFRF